MSACILHTRPNARILEIVLMFLEIENVKGPFPFFSYTFFLNSQTLNLINVFMFYLLQNPHLLILLTTYIMYN